MESVVLLEWSFTPKNYFEEEVRIEREDYEMVISKGKVEARINPNAYDKEHKMRDVLHDNLNDRFLGVQLLTHEPYELSKSTMCRLHSDGRRDVTIFPDPVVMTMKLGNVDLVHRDKDGNIIGDTRRDRIEKKKEFANLVEEYSSDAVVSSMLMSYKTAVSDPDNELFHLYEIRDSLSKQFNGERCALSALGLTSKKWSRLGQLANSEPLKQGRHRGKSIGELRDASEEELKEAREIARDFVESYMRYLDKQ